MARSLFLAPFLVTLTATVPLIAGPTAAQEAAPFGAGVAHVALVDGWRAANGGIVAGIAMEIAPGWHTYWRNPGEVGMPPAFDWRGSENLAAVSVQWPRPRLFENGGARSLGYEGAVMLPITVTPKDPGKPVRVALELSMGVCSEVCVPDLATLSASFGPKPGPGDPAGIRAALADRPLTPREAGVSAVSCALEAGADGLEMTAAVTFNRRADPGQLAVIESTQPGLWIGTPETSASGPVLTARAPVEAKTPGIDRSELRLTLVGGGQAIDIAGCGEPPLQVSAER